MSTPLPSSFSHLQLPEGVTFDGIQPSRRGDHLAFTDAETGSSFAVLAAEITSEKLASVVTDLRRSFAAPTTSPLPPVFQRAPRVFVAPDTNHY